ncbi:MAG: DUF6206 family protein [Acidimicrobiales bacterium]
MTANPITYDDLARLEADVSAALNRQDNSQLPVIGFGEISVALGYPADDPSHVCKRTPPLTPAQYGGYQQLVERYVAELGDAGLTVVDTEVMVVERDGTLIAYLVQPLLPAESIGHKVLQRADPDDEHPFLVALAETLNLVTDRLSVDAQVTNWSWNGTELTLLDVGTPFIWDAAGDLRFDMTPYLPMISAPLRNSARKDLTKVVDRWKQPSGVAVDIVANLLREGLDDWVEPATAALNRILATDDAIDVDAARAAYAEDLKTWPRLARLKRLERAWQTKVRRRQYDFFIHTTY